MLAITDHARDKMNRAGVTEEALQYAWDHRVSAMEPGADETTRKFAGRCENGRVLVIVVRAEDHRFIVTLWPRRR